MESLVAMPRGDGRLDSAPMRPPADRAQSFMAMASDGGGSSGSGMNNPAIRLMQAMGGSKQSLVELASLAPKLSGPIQQMIEGLEVAVAEEVAAMIEGRSPVMGQAG